MFAGRGRPLLIIAHCHGGVIQTWTIRSMYLRDIARVSLRGIIPSNGCESSLMVNQTRG